MTPDPSPKAKEAIANLANPTENCALAPVVRTEEPFKQLHKSYCTIIYFNWAYTSAYTNLGVSHLWCLVNLKGHGKEVTFLS